MTAEVAGPGTVGLASDRWDGFDTEDRPPARYAHRLRPPSRFQLGPGIPEPGKRRAGPIALGIVLMLVGLGLLGAGIASNEASYSASVQAGGFWQFKTTSLVAVAVSVGWSGGNNSTFVWLITGDPSCTNPFGVVDTEHGPNGTFTAGLVPGQTYYLYTCAMGSASAANFSYSAHGGGLTTIELLAILPLVAGVLLLVWGLRGKP